MQKRIIQISQPSMGIEEWEALKAPIESGWITQGPCVAAFERSFAERHQVKHALAVSNCTTALHLALLACGVKAGDEVIVPAFTWVSTANAVLYCNATPVFIDIELATFNLDTNQIKDKITSRTKAIIPVHLFGLCANIDAIKKDFPSLKIIEDAACAAGAALNGKPAGSLGDIGCFSFHPRKSITTGEGGMLTTNDDALAGMLNMLRNHGASISEEQRHLGAKPFLLAAYDIIGYNYRMTDLQGALGVVQIKKLDAFIDERSEWAAYYTSQLKNIAWLQTPVLPQGYKHGWQSYVTIIDERSSPLKRNDLMEALQKKGISTRPGTHAVHMLGAYANRYNIRPSGFPMAYAANECSMSLPLHNRMDKEDFEYIVEILNSF
jgi:perosamine synthetase